LILKKAFDSVSHPKLLIKLKAGNLLAWITDFLSNRSQCVRLGNSLSQPISVMSGVPQGSVIGPTLFLLFVNEVIDVFDNLAVSFKLYADDIKLYSCYNITSSCDDLSVAINRLYNWSVTWQLTLAVQKCFTCRICSHRLSSLFQGQTYKLNDTILPTVESIRD